jgi:glycosyltransferase 2 family protein
MRLDDLFTQMLRLRSAAISHGAVSPWTIVVDPGQESATLVDFRNGTSAASAFILDQDLAGAMASAALAAGPQRAAASAVRVLPPGPLDGALGHLRRAGLDPAVNVGLKGKKELLDRLRTTTAQAAHISVPELAEPRRLSWSQVLVAAGTLIGGWALILTLINAAHSFSTIRSAQWGWVAATVILCAATYFGTACADLGSVPGSLTFGRVVGLEVASTFTVLAGAVLAGVLAVPRWRAKVTGKLRPKLATARRNFTQLASQPSKIAQLFGGQLAAQLVVALALGAALHAFGAHLSLAALLIAVTTAGVLASPGPARRRGYVLTAGVLVIMMLGGTLPVPLYVLYEKQMGFGPLG